jgi:hypothetical protein
VPGPCASAGGDAGERLALLMQPRLGEPTSAVDADARIAGPKTGSPCPWRASKGSKRASPRGWTAKGNGCFRRSPHRSTTEARGALAEAEAGVDARLAAMAGRKAAAGDHDTASAHDMLSSQPMRRPSLVVRACWPITRL